MGKVDKSKVVGENNEEKTSNNDNSNDNDNENSNSKEEKKTIYTVVFMSYDDTIIDTKYVEEKNGTTVWRTPLNVNPGWISL